MKALFFCILIFAGHNLFSQKNSFPDSNQYIITGRVLDHITKETLSAASILFKQQAITTDQEGKFQLKLPLKYKHKNFTIKVLYIEYNPAKIKIRNKKKPITKELIFYLKKINIDLNEVIISQ